MNDNFLEKRKLIPSDWEGSWEDICTILEWPVVTGKKRQKQNKTLIQHNIILERKGHRYKRIPTDTAIPNTITNDDNLHIKIRKCKHANLAIVILLRKLLIENYEHRGNSYSSIMQSTITDFRLFKELYLCNDNVFSTKSDRLTRMQKEYPGFFTTPEEIEAFDLCFGNNAREMYKFVRNIKKTLTDRKYLYWDKPFFVRTSNGNFREATSDELGWITEADRLALKKMGLESEWQVRNCWQQVNGVRRTVNRWQEYHGMALTLLKDIQVISNESEQIVNYEKINRVIFNRDGVKVGLQLYSDKCSAELGIEMNNLMIDKIIDGYTRYFSLDATLKNEKEDSIAKGVLCPFSARKPEERFNSNFVYIAELTTEQFNQLPEYDRKIVIPVITTCRAVPDTRSRLPKTKDLVNASMTEKELLS